MKKLIAFMAIFFVFFVGCSNMNLTPIYRVDGPIALHLDTDHYETTINPGSYDCEFMMPNGGSVVFSIPFGSEFASFDGSSVVSFHDVENISFKLIVNESLGESFTIHVNAEDNTQLGDIACYSMRYEVN